VQTDRGKKTADEPASSREASRRYAHPHRRLSAPQAAFDDTVRVRWNASAEHSGKGLIHD